MIIEKSESYGISENGVIIVKGSKKRMLSLIKSKGGRERGFQLWYTPGTKVGDNIGKITNDLGLGL